MSIGEMHACYGRLCVDDSFRKLFNIDAENVLRQYSLTSDEADALCSIDKTMLDFFASSLKSKRKKRLLRAYPMVFALLNVDRYYQRYCQLYMSKPHTSSVQDAIDFGYFLEDSALQSEELPPYSADLVRFERLSYCTQLISNAATLPDEHRHLQDNFKISLSLRASLRGNVMMGSFQYDVTELEQLMQTGFDCMSVSPTDSYAILFRAAHEGNEPVMFRINNPTKILLETCDGARSLAEAAARAATIIGAPISEEQLLDAITRLRSLQIIDLSSKPVHSPHIQQIYGAADVESF